MASASSDLLLLCLDVQPTLLASMPQGPATLRRCQLAVAAANGLGVPVAFTEQVPTKLGGTEPALRALAPTAPVWPKHTFSALADPTIHAALRSKRSVAHLLICGLETAVCVYQTAADALAEDMQVTLLSDALCGRRSDDSTAALAALTRLGAHVLPVETVFYSILHDAQHPFFRSFTALVKAHA
jgi:nicotinamidase-related amidase